MPAPSPDRQSHQNWIRQARAQSDEAERHLIEEGLGLALGDSSGGKTTLRPDLFPGYALETEIHRGGQGTIYRAKQLSTGRRVAVKLMHDNVFSGPLERARFERETRVLAALHHPNIVAIHDGGSHDGRFFLVMDYIAGQPLDVYIASQSRSIRETLELFIQICDAVNAAHIGGIIHRDLKPANVRVDAEGRAYVLDFGLAKFTVSAPEGAGSEAMSPPNMTVTGQFLGSMPWAAPEQAEGSPSRIDTRTDVYALGVLLFQMLTGKFPYQVVGSVRSVLDNIAKAEPIRPRTLCREIDDELETIILKCLSKDRERRYQTAGELSRDLRRYLKGEPIEAKRDSAWYVLTKSLRRHTLAVAVAAGFVVLVSGSALALGIMYRGKAAEYARAERQRGEAVMARDRAEKAAGQASAVTQFLENMLSSADPEEGSGHEVKVVDVLKRASGQATEALAKQPEVQVAVRRALGSSYFGLGQYSEAEGEFIAALQIARQFLGEEHQDTRAMVSALGANYWIQGKFDQAEPLMRSGLEMELRLHGEDHVESITMMDNLASVLKRTGRPEEALQLNRRAFAAAERVLGPNHETTRNCLSNLAFGLMVAGHDAEAEAHFRRALEMDRSTSWSNREISTSTQVAFANLLVKVGKVEEGEQVARACLEERKRHLPAGHTLIGDSKQVLGRARLAQHDAAAAEPLFREALGIHQATLPAGSWRIAVTQCDLGLALTQLERFEEAERLLLESHATLNRTAGTQPRHEQKTIAGLADLYAAWEAAAPGTGKAEKAAEWRAKLPTTQAATPATQSTSNPKSR
ncbi:MAG TPA: tetratricopeptide repeat protein [Phycisphaerae bacterium]|nr:tetratricopeptide repeat protein [Phycisphaerae bacterium]